MPPRVGRRRTTKEREDQAEEPQGGFGSDATSRINKKFGKDTVVDSDQALAEVKDFISTQCYGLNFAMHLPGIPVGRLTVIRGDFMSGKSTIAAHIMAETQKKGGFAVYIDTEYAFDKKHFAAMGVDFGKNKWMMPQVDTVEEAIGVIDELIDTAREYQDEGNERLVTIVWDSVGATATKAELDAEFGEARPGLHARLLSSALRRLTKKIAEYRIALVFVNQEKEKIDFFGPAGAPKTMTAEKPLMFHASIALRPAHMKMLTNSKKEPVGIRVACNVRKNKLAAPFAKCEFIIYFGVDGRPAGIDDNASILSIAAQRGIVQKSAAWYKYQGEKFQERNFGKVLAEHPEIMDELDALMQKAGKEAPPSDDEDGPEDEDGDDA